MAVGDLQAGFIGYAEVDGTTIIRCNEFNVNPRQEVLWYDHIVGLRDSLPDTLNIFSGKDDVGNLNMQKILFRAGVKIYQGSISFPASESSMDAMFDLAKTGNDFGLVFKHTCGISRSLTGCKVNGYSFSVASGDMVNINVDIMAIECEDTSVTSLHEDTEKFMTWDTLKVECSAITSGDGVSSLDFSINNNCTPIYTAGANNGSGGAQKLSPYVIRVGMQEVSGSVNYYNKGGNLSFVETDTPQTLKVTVGDWTQTLNILVKPIERNASMGPIISALPFVGCGYALGT